MVEASAPEVQPSFPVWPLILVHGLHSSEPLEGLSWQALACLLLANQLSQRANRQDTNVIETALGLTCPSAYLFVNTAVSHFGYFVCGYNLQPGDLPRDQGDATPFDTGALHQDRLELSQPLTGAAKIALCQSSACSIGELPARFAASICEAQPSRSPQEALQWYIDRGPGLPVRWTPPMQETSNPFAWLWEARIRRDQVDTRVVLVHWFCDVHQYNAIKNHITQRLEQDISDEELLQLERVQSVLSAPNAGTLFASDGRLHRADLPARQWLKQTLGVQDAATKDGR